MTKEQVDSMRKKLRETRLTLGNEARQTSHEKLFPAIQVAIYAILQAEDELSNIPLQ